MIKRQTVKIDNNHVACYVCGKTYGKLALTRKETRKLAEADGWIVRIPEWQMQLGISKADWLATHKTRTIDVCGECMLALQKEAVDAVYEGRTFYHRDSPKAKPRGN